jgi:hypothetical protein
MYGVNVRGWVSVGLAVAAVPLLLWLAQAALGPSPAPDFSDVRALQAWAEAHGLYCRSDWQDGRVTAAVAVSTRPLTWEEVGRLCPGDRERGSRWQGVVWAVTRSPAVDATPGTPWGGECRAWGGILVTGDPALLDDIEGGRW